MVNEKQVKRILDYLDSREESVKQFLSDLIRIPSISGGESAIQNHLLSRFKQLNLQGEAIPVDPAIKQDPEYTFAERDLDYTDRPNVLVCKPGRGQGRSIILNAHSDTVPAENWPEAFTPTIQDDTITGRGACDDKGQIAVLYLVLEALQTLDIQLAGDIWIEMVIEEEIGGNGSLALIRSGYHADGAIVLEPTNMKIHPANRGVVWFTATVTGKPVHMGYIYEGVSAIDLAFEVIGIFKEYEKKLIEESRNHPLFVMHRQPVQLNVGMLNAGDWPATVPASAVLRGGVGFLPNKSMDSVKRELERSIRDYGSEWLQSHHCLVFDTQHNDAFETSVRHPLVKTFQNACVQENLPDDLSGWVVSCDARLFKHAGNMPTIVFGPGNLKDAHSAHERIQVRDIVKSAKVLAVFLCQWCGLQN